MYRKIAAVGATAAAILGVGTAAVAASGPGTTGGTGSASTTPSTTNPSGANGAHGKRAHAKRALLGHAVHGSIVTDGKDGYVRHSGIRGAVTAVSPTAITVKSSDGYSQTFTLTKDTRVRERTAGQGKGTKGSLSDVKAGDKVGVLGKSAASSSGSPTATIIVDGLTK